MRHSAEKQVARDAWQNEPIVLASSFLMRRAERQRELLEAANWDLIVLDEAHHARRRGAGTAQEKGPNALLGLMRKLKDKCRSLLFLTATPMQVHPVEIWDLLDLLGLPPEWRYDDYVFLKYFQKAAANPPPDDMEYLAGLFRAMEAAFGELSEAEIERMLPSTSNLSARKSARVRDISAIPRRTLDAVDSALRMLFKPVTTYAAHRP